MKSPFPGMDPYTEACGLWQGFHGRLVHRSDETLAAVLPRGYTIDTAVRSYVVVMEAEGKKEHLVQPDVTVTEPVSGKKPRRTKGGIAMAEAPDTAESVSMRA